MFWGSFLKNEIIMNWRKKMNTIAVNPNFKRSNPIFYKAIYQYNSERYVNLQNFFFFKLPKNKNLRSCFFVIFDSHLVVWYLFYEAGVGEISFLFLWTFTEWFVFITGSEVFRLTSKNSFIRLINLLTLICSFAVETNSIFDHSYYLVIFKYKEREH